MGPDRHRPQLELEFAEHDGVQVVALAGELDVGSVDELEIALAGASARAGARVCLDMSRLAFIDSTGLAAVIRGHLAVVESGGGFAIVVAPGAVRRTLETTGLMEMLSVVDDRDAALQDLA
ncbi:MAG: anti-sigma factor antagonist [Solirubrobacteraceae bacterium]|jgi:anti-anti-sigma factor|nr:anti-sigma factor antagonist [Solirubrobacteraceae bacterium]